MASPGKVSAATTPLSKRPVRIEPPGGLLMTVTEYVVEWQAAGACLAADPEIFFPVSGTGASPAQIDQARQNCGGCPARRGGPRLARRPPARHRVPGCPPPHAPHPGP